MMEADLFFVFTTKASPLLMATPQWSSFIGLSNLSRKTLIGFRILRSSVGPGTWWSGKRRAGVQRVKRLAAVFQRQRLHLLRLFIGTHLTGEVPHSISPAVRFEPVTVGGGERECFLCAVLWTLRLLYQGKPGLTLFLRQSQDLCNMGLRMSSPRWRPLRDSLL